MFFWIARQARSSDAAVRKRAAGKLAAGGRSARSEGPVPCHVALLLELVKDPDGEVRAAAYDGLGRVADGRAAAAMAAGLADIEKLGEMAAISLCGAAARAFEGIGSDAVPALLQLAKARSPKAREVAVVALGAIGGADAERALVAALQDNRSSVRQVAVRALARSAAAGSIGSLSAALEHRDPATRRTAIEAMIDMKGDDASRALARRTSDPDRAVREAAVRALARQGSPDAVDALLGVFQGQDRDLRQLAAAALKELAWQPATPEQRALRAIVVGDYQAAAAEGHAAIELLGALVTDKSVAVRKAATEALGRTSHAAAVKPLLLSLQDGDGAVRHTAAEALVRVGAPSAVAVAAAVHEAARAAAPDIVVRIGGPAAAPLVDLLEQGEPFTHEGVQVRRIADDQAGEQAGRAAHLLGRLIGQAAPTIDAQVLGRVARLRDLVSVREITPASRRDAVTTVADVVVDCKELRGRAAAELDRRKV
jgi:bilin biosynthesis protein